MPSFGKTGPRGASVADQSFNHLSRDNGKGFKSKVVAPRNPKLVRAGERTSVRVCFHFLNFQFGYKALTGNSIKIVAYMISRC